MKVVDLADQIYREIGSPDDLGIPQIVFWLTSNIGVLNNLIETDYSLDVSEQPTPELGDSEAAILKYLYLIHYYGILIRTNLQAGAYDWVEVQEGDTMIRRVSRNEVSKSYSQLKNALQDQLNKMISSYKQNGALPVGMAACHDLLRFYRV